MRWLSPVRLALAVAGLSLLAAACSYSTGDERGAGGPEPGRLEEPVVLGTPDPPEVSPTIPAAGGIPPPGACVAVVYTPPSDPEPREGELCAPEGAARDVGVVLIHGGGGTTGDHTAMTAWADRYLDDGYTTLAIDYTLFQPGGASPVFPHPEQNVKAAIQYLRGVSAEVGIDPERIVVHGQSAGARIGAVAHVTPGEEWFHSARTWLGVEEHVNAFIGFYSTYDGTMNFDEQYYGGLRDDPDPGIRRAWVEADSVVNAPQALGPAMLFTGELDWSEIARQQAELVRGVQAAGYEGHSVVVPGAEHGFDVTPAGLTAQGEEAATLILAWLDRIFTQAG